jgi:glycosyltransferase involved in cell wall biosynthesis
LSARWPSSQISNSRSAAENARLLNSLFVPAQLSVVCNGVDLDELQSFPVPSDEQVRIVGIGYLLPVKRWEWLLAAVRELKKKGLNCMVEIAGDGPLQSSLEQRAKDLGVADRVQFLGHIDDIPSLLARAAFVVHTADSEGCPNAIMEAMACGRAVVATDAGEVPLLVEDGKTGFIVPRDDNSALAERMERLITDHDICRRMGKAGRAKIEREFGLDRLIEETLAVYRSAGWGDT